MLSDFFFSSRSPPPSFSFISWAHRFLSPPPLPFPFPFFSLSFLFPVPPPLSFLSFSPFLPSLLREQGYEIVPGAPNGPVIVDATCQFLIAAVYPVRLSAIMYGGAPGRSSFNTYYELRDAGEPDRLYCTGSSRVVWVDYAKGNSVPVPENLRRLLPG